VVHRHPIGVLPEKLSYAPLRLSMLNIIPGRAPYSDMSHIPIHSEVDNSICGYGGGQLYARAANEEDVLRLSVRRAA
jgi:hypothetical protein